MEELAEEIIKLLARIVLTVARIVVAIIWAAGEVLYYDIGWYLGWPVMRVITFNNFPKEKIHEGEQVSSLPFLIVSIVGIAFQIYLTYLLVLYLDVVN